MSDNQTFLSAKDGILSENQLLTAFDKKQISVAEPLLDGQIQPASLDLRLGGAPGEFRRLSCPGAARR